MVVASVDVTKYIIGAAEVYYRPTEVLTPWTSVGLTTGDVVARVERRLFNPSEELNGVNGMIAGLDYESTGGAEFEFTLPEMSGPKLALAIPGAIQTTLATTDTGGGGSTDLAAASIVGATNIKLTAVTNFAVGDFVKIGTGATIEYRQLTMVGTAGSGGTGVSFRDQLLFAHAAAETVVEVVGDGKTEVVASTVRRQPLTAYMDWALVAQSPADYYELLIYRGISTTESTEFTFGDETLAGIRVTIGARKKGTDLTLPAWKIRAPAA